MGTPGFFPPLKHGHLQHLPAHVWAHLTGAHRAPSLPGCRLHCTRHAGGKWLTGRKWLAGEEVARGEEVAHGKEVARGGRKWLTGKEVAHGKEVSSQGGSLVPYPPCECTQSRLISEAKQGWVWLVLGWEEMSVEAFACVSNFPTFAAFTQNSLSPAASGIFARLEYYCTLTKSIRKLLRKEKKNSCQL